jgi:CspA family cold shock protein
MPSQTRSLLSTAFTLGFAAIVAAPSQSAERQPTSGTNTRNTAVHATGTVKWFNKARGFGFITEDGNGEDVFAHHTTIQREGFRALAEGQKVEFDVAKGPKKLQACNAGL